MKKPDYSKVDAMNTEEKIAAINAAYQEIHKQSRPTETLCWMCGKCTGRCSWSQEFKPVEGWDAILNKIEGEDSYFVNSCPEFALDFTHYGRKKAAIELTRQDMYPVFAWWQRVVYNHECVWGLKELYASLNRFVEDFNAHNPDLPLKLV